MTELSTVIVEREGRVALITLNRPAARNAVSYALARDLCAAVDTCQDAGAIVITGAGKAFCAGLDLKELGVDKLSEMPSISDAVHKSGVPVIAAVNGAAVTNGIELALACDVIVASPEARFADTHVRVGVFPGPVLVDLPKRVGMARAREMTLTGNFVDAETALRIGLVNHLVPAGELVSFAKKLAADMAETDPVLIARIREAWEATEAKPYEEAMTIRREIALLSGSGQRSAAEIAAHREDVISRAKDQPG